MNTNNKTVVQGNSLIEGCYRLNIDELRIISLAISKIDSKSDFKPVPIEITAKEFAKVYALEIESLYSRLKLATKSALRKPITIYEDGDTIERPWFSELRYDTSGASNSVKVIFSEFIRPHLYALSKDSQFTQAKFKYISKLDTPFSFRLYLWLSKEKNFDKNKANGSIVCTLNVEEMKKRAGLENKHKEYRRFKEKVLNPAVDKINLFTDMIVTFEGIRTGLRTTDIRFTFKASPKKITLQLPPRPQVKAGSHAEGEYFNECINLLLRHEKDTGRLEKENAEKLVSFFLKSGNKFAAEDYRLKYKL